MFKNLDRKSHEAIIAKCTAPRCDYCTKFKVKAEKAWEFLKEREFKWFNPSPSTTHPGHFKTYLEMCEIDQEYFNTGDGGLPCSLSIGRCPYCPSMEFLSAAERSRHISVLHAEKKGDGNRIWKTQHRCLFVIRAKTGSTRCNLTFKSNNQLKEHKTQVRTIYFLIFIIAYWTQAVCQTVRQ